MTGKPRDRRAATVAACPYADSPARLPRILRLLKVLVAFAALVVGFGATAYIVIGRDGVRAPDGIQVETIGFDSTSVGESRRVTVVVPEGAVEPKSRPLLVFLHGRGNDERSYLDDAFFSALSALGARAPIVAFPDGDDSSYWHDRKSGEWGRYVVDEVIPRVRKEFDTSRSRVALGGISMGGFGALDLARRHPNRFCGVGAHSPALFTSARRTAAGAFDDAKDFARHDVVRAAVTRGARFAGRTPLFLDIGEEDPFRPGFDKVAEALDGRDRTDIRTRPGGHDIAYWRSHWSDYLGFYAAVCTPKGAT